MANEWNVVSEEPARPARVASGPQVSAAADPWAVVGEAPEGVIHDLPPVRAETSAVGQQILGAFSEIMGGAQPAQPTPVARISVPQDFRAPIETAAVRDRRRAATMAGSVFAEAPPERTAGELASDLYDRGRIGVRGVASGLVDLANVPQYAVNTLNASAEGWARMLGSDLDIPTLPAYDWTRGTQAELASEQDAIRAGMSPAAIRQAAEFGATDGIVSPIAYLLANPGEAAGFAVEQAPQFLSAGLPGGVGAKLAGAGLMAGGQTGAQVAAENQQRVARGEITQDEADQLTAQAAISSGVVNSMLQRIVPGGTAIEEAMAGARQAGLSRARGAALGGLGEGLSGFGEEAVDQIAQNEGTGRPALEGALKAGTLGAIMEGGIGSLAGAYSAGGRAPAQPESREQRQPPAADAPRTNAIAPEMLAAGNEALREQAAPPRRRAAAEAGAVIDDRLQALRDAAGRRLPDEERAALAAEAADLEALVREQDALSAAGVMGSPETRLTAAERAQADQRRAEIRAALEADRAAAEYGRQLQALERQLGNIDTDAGLIDLAERIAGTPVDTGVKPAVQRAPQHSAANATGENRVQDQEGRRQAEGRTQAEGQGQAQEVVATEGGSGVSATPAAVPASSLEGDGENVSATGEGAAGGEQSRLDLIDAWRAATTADERADAAQRIAEHDARAADRGRAGGEARAGDGARREAGNAGAVPADVRGAGEQAPASRQVRDAAAGRVADRYQDTDDADIRAALGSAARGITVHRSIAELHPDDRDRLGVRESDDDIEGLYDPDTGRVHIFEANLDTVSMPAAARRAWVAAHERSGHAGLRGMFADAGKSLTATLRRARQNPTIDAMVRAMEGGERPERGDILVEEAIVELGAALRTGDFGHIRDRYGVDVSPAQRSAVRDFIARIVSAVREALGKPAASMSDADVWRLIEDANRYAKRGEVRGTSRRARGPVASRARRVVTATTGAGTFQLTDEAAPAGTDFSEFGEVRQVIARDGDKQIGKLVYANDGTPPTIEVAPEYRRRGVATAMLKLAREQGGVLGDARSGMRRDGGRPGYRTDAGQAFREGADESRVTLVASRASRLLKNLTPAEQKKVTDRVAAKIEEQLKSLPSKREMAAIAHAGRAKRGWYRQSAETISSVFGADAPRFAGLLAALSPQISVEGNLKNALNVWAGWIDAGRPEDSAEILDVLRGTLRRTYGNTLQAWENNTVRALQGQGILSGPKVDSFMRNLLGDVEEVTNDAWMANYSLVNQTIFKGGLNVRGTDPGKGTGYLAMNARIRETAREMTRLTGETWSPAEVQETIWSWAKTITEMADSATEVRSAEELVLDRAVTDELIASTPDFGTLFTMPEYRQILEEAGYGEQIRGIDFERDAARQARQEPAARSEARPFAEEAQLKLERQAARRIDKLRKQRIEAARVEEDGEVPFSRRSPSRYDALPGAPKVRGATGPDPKLVAVAERYAADNGIDLRRQAEYVKADPRRGARIAAAYEAMKHEPQSPRVRRAYANLIEQTRAQYDALEEAGYRFYFTDPAADPYNGNPWDAMRDLRENSRMGVFPTDAGFGSGATDIDVRDNPLMADTGLRWPFGSERGELRPVLANDLFRAVHDAFGHGLEGAGFRADGEENAWQAHVRLFTGDAIGAITTETRGQNSWLNFGPYGESNRTAKVEDTVFADQKTGLMPEWTWTEGRAGDMPVSSRRAATLNIGLSTKELRGGGELTEAEVLSAVKASGAKVLKATRQVSDSEPTLVIDIDRKLTKDEGDRISAALDQEAIVQRHDSGVGELFGPMAEKWSPYNPAWFVMHDGGRASDSPIASRRTPFSAKKRQPDAVSADAYHYSNTPDLTALDTSYAGTAGAGRERRRFGMGQFGKRGGTAARLGFYVREPGAEIPGAESVVRDAGGQHLYRVQLSNLYDLATDPRGYADEAGANQDYLEELISDGGFDGFLAGPQPGIDTPTAVVFDIGKKKIPVEAVEGEGVVASRRQINTPAFKRWFGDSKVVGENGEPLVVYHASTFGDFDTFDKSKQSKGMAGFGFYFTDRDGSNIYTDYGQNFQANRDWQGNPKRVNVTPVFLRMENPLVVDDIAKVSAKYGKRDPGAFGQGRTYAGLSPDAQTAIQRDGYDGVIATEHVKRARDGSYKVVEPGTKGAIAHPVYVVFEPNQIKSAIGNKGNFDPNNLSIIASRRTPQQAQAERNSLFGRLAADGYAMGNATQPQPGGRFVSLQRAADGLRVKLQDKMLPALRVQERATAGGASQAGVSTLTLDDMQNAYRMENLRHGATKEGVDKLNDEHVMPIQRALRNAGFSLAMFEDYLYALAAPERNASIAQINRGMPDAGSGIATQQARDILAGRAPGVYSGKVLTPDALRLFKSLEPHVRAIRNIALDSAVEAGQLPAQLARALRQKYPNYVPMRGKDDVLDQARTAAGRGLSQARSGMKRALGRGQDNIPQNVLGELIGDAQRGIAAREQSKATKAFLRFALANPMPELFEVEPVDLEWKFSESTGEAYLGVKGRAEDVDSKMIVMQDGKPVYVKFHDEELRDAILNMGVEDYAGFTKWAGWLNRWRSAVLTRFNPAFPPVNIMRDILFGGTAVSTELGAAAAARAAGIYPRAMAAAWAHARGRRGDASVPDAQKTIADWVQEFYETGGSTGLTMTDEPADLQRKLEMASMATGELMKLAASGRPLAASAEAISRAGKPIIDLIESANEASENALRISTYIEQRQRGVSKFKAAEYAKNVTINFNRKGQLGPVLNAIYLFFNASMQGTNAVLRVLRNPKAMAFLAGMGALQAMLAASMMGDDDDDGITQWDTVPDYVKRTSLVIPVGDDRYFALPMPYGFNLITYVGGRATQYAYSGRRRTDSNVALDILKSATEAFSPVPVQDGYSALFGDQLAFFMRLGANRDDFGGKLTNTDEYSHYPVPLALQGKATTPRIYHSTAQLLAKLGGGDLAEKIPPVGYLDVSPEQLEAVTNYFGGGITSLLNKSMTWGEQMQAGNLRGVSDVVAATPIVSRFYGKPSDARAISQRYYGERGEFARHRAIVNERVATGMSLEEAKADRPKEYVKGLDQGTYKRSGKRKDGSRYRAGEKRPGIQETEGTPTYTAKDVRKRVSAIGELIAGVREGMTNAELAAAYSAQHRIAKQTVGSNFMPEGMTGKPADLGLPAGFAEATPAPARVKNRAIKLLQDLRAAEEQRLLRALQFQRRLDSVKMPAQQVLDQAKLDRGFEAMFGGDNFDPEATSP